MEKLLFITKEFSFDSAHQLDWHKGKCKNLHGHTYKLKITLQGYLNSNGVVMDFGDIKNIVNSKIIEKMDHKYLNKIIKNPTAENMVVWIWKQLKSDLNLYEIILYETPTSYVTYRG